jgi:hypothetical protein
MNNIKQFFVFLLVPAQLCWSVQAGNDAVICIEKDGHVAIENSLNGECGIPEEAGSGNHFTGPSSITAEDSHCDDCIDVPILESITCPDRKTILAVEIHLMLISITASNPYGALSTTRTAKVSAWSSKGMQSDPNHRRTTVFLI